MGVVIAVWGYRFKCPNYDGYFFPATEAQTY